MSHATATGGRALAVAWVCAVMLAGCGKARKERFPATGAPAVLFEPPPREWTRNTTTDGSHTEWIAVAPDQACSMAVMIVHERTSRESFRRLATDMRERTDQRKKLTLLDGMEKVQLAGLNGVVLKGVAQKPVGEMDARLMVFRLDGENWLMIDLTTWSQAPQGDRDEIEAFIKSVEVMSATPGAARTPDPDERLLEAQEDVDAALDKKDYDAAITACGNGLALYPKNAELFYKRARAWRGKGERDKAMADVNEAIGLDPKYENAYNLRGLLFRAANEQDKAIEDFNVAIQLAPDFASPYENRARAYFSKGDMERTIADSSQAIALEPDNVMEYLSRAAAYSNEKKLDEAMRDFDSGCKLEPHNALALAGRGMIYEMKHDDPKALAQYDMAIQFAPDKADYYISRAQVRRRLKDYAGEAADYAEWTRLKPDDAHAWNSLAWRLATCPDAKVRDGGKAVDAAMKACGLSQWQTPNDVDTLAAAYAESGDFAGAVKFEEWYLALPGVTEEEAKGARERLADYQNRQPYREELNE